MSFLCLQKSLHSGLTVDFQPLLLYIYSSVHMEFLSILCTPHVLHNQCPFNACVIHIGFHAQIAFVLTLQGCISSDLISSMKSSIATQRELLMTILYVPIMLLSFYLFFYDDELAFNIF